MMMKRSDCNGCHCDDDDNEDVTKALVDMVITLISVMMIMMRSDNNGYHCDDDHKDEDVTAAFITIVITL